MNIGPTRPRLRWIPFALSTLRLLLGPLALACAVFGWPKILFAPILIIATLSDIYDGILARRLGVATSWLRRYDSVTDVIYYLFILYCAWIAQKTAIKSHWLPISLLVGSEIATIFLSLFRFGVLPATHTYMAKLYGLCLLGCCLGFLAFNAPGWIITVLAVVGVAANSEISAILLMRKVAPVDVKSVFSRRHPQEGQSSLHSPDA
jgi:CDP-diacylglycerol--glycerol-3-phosphate 3-phosphatidyltransferase